MQALFFLEWGPRHHNLSIKTESVILSEASELLRPVVGVPGEPLLLAGVTLGRNNQFRRESNGPAFLRQSRLPVAPPCLPASPILRSRMAVEAPGFNPAKTAPSMERHSGPELCIRARLQPCRKKRREAPSSLPHARGPRHARRWRDGVEARGPRLEGTQRSITLSADQTLLGEIATFERFGLISTMDNQTHLSG